MKSSYKIRSSRFSDAGRIAQFMNLVYDFSFDSTYFEWKYGNNPHGKTLVLLAEDGDKIIGLRSFWPRQYGNLIAYQAVDASVHPDYRRQGIFTRLTKAAIAEALKQPNVCGFFNFPHRTSMPGYLKLNWQRLHRLHWWIRPVPRITLRGNSVEPIEYSSIEHSKTTAEGLPRFNRDEAYLTWRYHNHPTQHYTYWDLGLHNNNRMYAITTTLKRRGISIQVLVDLLIPTIDETALDHIIGTIMQRVLKLGKPLVVLEGTLGYNNQRLLKQMFVRLPRVGVNYVASTADEDRECIPFSSILICPGDFDTF